MTSVESYGLSIDPQILAHALRAQSKLSQNPPSDGFREDDPTLENIFLPAPEADEFYFATKAEEFDLLKEDRAAETKDDSSSAAPPPSDV